MKSSALDALDSIGIVDELTVTTQPDDLAACGIFLVYLHALTWTSGADSDAFAEEVRTAMDLGLQILLVHEMIGAGGQEERCGCEFGDFFRSPPDGTPGDLLKRGLYASIAVAMKGGAWRETSTVMLAQAVAGKEDCLLYTSPSPRD